MVLTISILVFITIALLSYFLISIYSVSSQSMEMRFKIIGDLNKQQTNSEVEKMAKKTFSERILVPLGQKFAANFKTFTPSGFTEFVDRKLMLAGGIAGLSAEQFIAVTCIMMMLTSGLSMLLSLILKLPMAKMIGIICYALLLTLIFPMLMLSVRISARQKSIQKDLPDVLDLVTVSVEAGLSFDGALAKMSEKMSGTLVEEFSRGLQEMRMGVTRKDALKGMSYRCDNKDLSLFVSALVQADQLGVSIGSVLRVQAVSIRKSRQMQIEQIAAKAPIKILFPLVTCIFPTVFIVVLGPAMLKISTQLFK